MVGRNKFRRRRIVFGIVEVLNVIQAVIGTVGQIYGLRISLCVVDGPIQCNHQFFSGFQLYLLVEIPDSRSGRYPSFCRIKEFTVHIVLIRRMRVVRIDHTQCKVADIECFRRIVIQYDILIHGKRTRTIVFRTASYIQFLNQHGTS